MKKLNVACGFEYLTGFINIDNDFRVRADVYRNLEQGLPFDSDSIDEVYSKHTLEHINPDKIHWVIAEIYRVLKNGGRFKVIVPINKGWLSSPEHKCPWSNNSVIFLTEWNTRENYKWKKISEKTLFVDENKPESEELHFELEAIK
jgi:ubiquinone/menaquinone biosynthesis C-methylase UbiE